MKKVDFIFITSILSITGIIIYLNKISKKLLLYFLILLCILPLIIYYIDLDTMEIIKEKEYSRGLRDLFNYKLGDLVYDDKFNIIPVRLIYKTYFSKTIGAEYARRTSETKNFDILHNIIKSRTNNKNIPKENEIIFHIRSGDVIEFEYKEDIDDLLNGIKKYNYSKAEKFIKDGKDYLLSYEKINNKILNINRQKYNKIILVGGYHGGKNHVRSEEYVNKIKKFLSDKNFEVEIRLNKFTADEDLIYMCNSKIFIKSGGGFSEIISEIVKRNNNISL